MLLSSELTDLDWVIMSSRENTLLIPLIYGMYINAILFYSNAYYFIPKYLHNHQIRKYWKIVILLLLSLSLLELIFDVFYIFNTPFSFTVEFAKRPEPEQQAIIQELFITYGILDLLINTVFWAMAFLYRMPKDWRRNEKLKQQLVEDKLNAELDFLKAQINPHFLFNGINSIYHLMGEDVAKAQKILLRFSELLRYQLYECKEDFIPLSKELQYISNYLEIETIRKGEDAMIQIDLPKNLYSGEDKIPKIAPLLFAPFLENAFKYLSLYSEKTKNRLEVRIDLEHPIIHLFVKNTVDIRQQKTQKKSASGIGLENVKRRLNILYPQKHILLIEEKEDYFLVNLTIELA